MPFQAGLAVKYISTQESGKQAFLHKGCLAPLRIPVGRIDDTSASCPGAGQCLEERVALRVIAAANARQTKRAAIPGRVFRKDAAMPKAGCSFSLPDPIHNIRTANLQPPTAVFLSFGMTQFRLRERYEVQGASFKF